MTKQQKCLVVGLALLIPGVGTAVGCVLIGLSVVSMLGISIVNLFPRRKCLK